MRLYLFAVLLGCVSAFYDDNVKYEEDYDDAWETMEEYNKQEHHFVVHKNVLPTEVVEEETYLARLKRESEETGETYEDAWMNNMVEDTAQESHYEEESELMWTERQEEQTGGTIDNPTSSVKYSIGKELGPGDVIEIHGTYSSGTGWFSANIMDENENVMLHVNPRPNKKQTVLNSKTGSWKAALKCELPSSLQDGKKFVMRIVLMDEFYSIYFNGRSLSKTFPYRQSFSLATDITLWGGTNGFTWNKIVLPGSEKAREYTEPIEFKSKVDGLRDEIQARVGRKSVQEIKSYANSTEGSLAIFQWWLMRKVQGKGEVLSFGDETLDWILSNREVLEMFMTSGDVQGNKYTDALRILENLIKKDPQIKEDPLRLRLAVATALTHSTPVSSMAVSRNKIKPLSVYQEYVTLSQEEGALFKPFFEVTAWHLRYVVGSWQTEEERSWARENTPAGFDNPSKIGDATHRMMKYKLYNDDGFRVFNRANYYYYLPVTLEAMHEVGGVCGAISKVAAGMCHSYGVPATPVGQPGHCAYIWYRNGGWVLGNDVSGWGSSSTHSGIQYTWMKPAYYFRVMNDAQKNLEGYRLSEKMRIASKIAEPQDRFSILEDASTECPYNFAVWMDLETAMEHPSLQKETVQEALLPSLLAHREREKKVSDIAKDKKVTSECFGGTAFRINDDQDGTAYCKETTGDFELDLERPSKINELKFHWWGQSKPAEYDIYAMSEEGTYVLVRTQEDERVVGTFNHWSYLQGWEMKTSKIKVDMRNGKLDYWGMKVYFGIRALNVLGFPVDVLEDVSTGNPVTADIYSTDPESLVDADNSTIWSGTGENSTWFEIDLKKICILDNIEMTWEGDERPENVRVTYKTGNSMETEALTEDPFNKVPLDMDSGTKLRVEIAGSGPGQGLKGVKACGVSYGGKDIMKLKINHAFDNHFFVKRDLIKAMEGVKYED
ncbi:hypothetical protein ACHWQZ_G008852 [Mnemiopsis leidyi]